MALFDFVPVFLFLVSAVILQRELYGMMSKGAFALFSSGTIMVVVAGVTKALWKLLYALNVCDFERLNQMFFPLQTCGFLLAGISMIALLFFRQDEGKTKLSAAAAVPAVYSGTMLFVVLMILGVLGLCGGLAVIAARKKKTAACVLFVFAFFMLLGMGYLSSKDFSNPSMNWVAEGVNTVAQLSFLSASCMIHKKAEA